MRKIIFPPKTMQMAQDTETPLYLVEFLDTLRDPEF